MQQTTDIDEAMAQAVDIGENDVSSLAYQSSKLFFIIFHSLSYYIQNVVLAVQLKLYQLVSNALVTRGISLIIGRRRRQ